MFSIKIFYFLVLLYEFAVVYLFINIFIVVIILITLFYCVISIQYILRINVSNPIVSGISKIIRDGAVTYLIQQYKYITLVSILVICFLYYVFGIYPTVGFCVGAILSSFSGFLGMFISVYSNEKTAICAAKNVEKAFNVSFKAGACVGLIVFSFGLSAVFFYYKFLLNCRVDERLLVDSLISLGFGASLISIFARLGGGIFTKGADIGADLVGKLELGIPEDDSRNPAVIADNVGDNVGDCAGMSADLFETFIVTSVSCIILPFVLDFYTKSLFTMYPILVCSGCLLSTIFGLFFSNLDVKKNVMKTFYRVLFITVCLSCVTTISITYFLFGFKKILVTNTLTISSVALFFCVTVGFFLTFVLMLITEYYTSFKYNPVKSIAIASETGHATNIIQGLAVSLQSTFLPIVFICLSIFITYYLAGIYGVSLGAVGMVSLSAFVVAIDVYGPITDNAGGIVVMSGLGTVARENTDLLDSYGNVTKAVTKGYAIGSAALAALVLFTVFTNDVTYFINLRLSYSLDDPFVLIGLFFGGSLPFLFCSFALIAVRKVGSSIVNEVRRQFTERPEIIEYKAKPDYNNAIKLLTKAAIYEMIKPAVLSLFLPIVFFYLLRFSVGVSAAFISLGAFLIGCIVTGVFLAISMTSGGGAWDNAKKYIEMGNCGGTKSLAYRAAVTGDTVGDPYKDTAGPAINPLIKVVSIVALLITSSFYV